MTPVNVKDIHWVIGPSAANFTRGQYHVVNITLGAVFIFN